MSLQDTALQAAEAAAEAIRRARLAPLNVQSKGCRDVLTQADLDAEKAITDIICLAYPDHAILSEEDKSVDLGTWEPPAGALWIIDPLDGTSNFSRDFPHYCTSVAVMVDGVLQAGAIIDPVRGDAFTASRGHGAALNGESIHVSEVGDLGKAIVACDWSRTINGRRILHAIAGRMLARCHTLRVAGSAAMNIAYVAAGRLDVYFHYSLSPWDMAAGLLMVEEAGGHVTTLDGSPFSLTQGSLLVSNSALHEAALAEVRPVLESRV